VRRGGYEQMTIRSLAADLGISPMALYHHVRDKDDLLDDVVDRLLARAWKPRADPTDWRAWIVEAADKLRHLLVAQPAALHVYLAHPVTSPAALVRMDSVMAVLRQALGDEHSAQRAYAAIHTYTVGFAALEGSRSGWQPPQDRQATTARTGRSRDPQRPLSENPDLVQRLAAYTTADQFRQGLNYLLDGIDRHANSR
jgi:TetR/AcrR family transcriptional regulator, tetracycline repressor protein